MIMNQVCKFCRNLRLAKVIHKQFRSPHLVNPKVIVFLLPDKRKNKRIEFPSVEFSQATESGPLEAAVHNGKT